MCKLRSHAWLAVSAFEDIIEIIITLCLIGHRGGFQQIYGAVRGYCTVQNSDSRDQWSTGSPVAKNLPSNAGGEGMIDL